jgi:hypothetical protein
MSRESRVASQQPEEKQLLILSAAKDLLNS